MREPSPGTAANTGAEAIAAFVARLRQLSPRQRAEAIQIDQRRRWQHGDRLGLEVYLEHLPAWAADTETALDLIYHEVLLREENGERPRLDEYTRRFPQFAASLERQFAVHEALEEDESGPPPPPVAVPAPLIPGYEVLSEVGRGGLGVVYKARQVSLNRPVALKMIRASGKSGSSLATRFRTEAEVIARLQHPNIVQIYEVGEYQSRPYLALEFVEGGSLAQRLDGAPQPPRAAAHLVRTLARAIHFAHEKGVVHRDLKPANVLIADCGLGIANPPNQSAIRSPQSAIPKIADFGLAKLVDGPGGSTRTGEIIGTPLYMAPEQARGRERRIGPPADVYSLGAILYELLTGRPPFQADTPMDTLVQVAFAEPVPPRQLQPKVPRDLDTICLKCLQKDPGKRYATAQALADDLRCFLVGQPILARPSGRGEHLYRWVRRRPALATVSVGLVLTTLLGFVAVTWQWQRARTALELTRQANTLAEQQREAAEKQRVATEEAQRDTEYARAAAEEAGARAAAAKKQAERALAQARARLYFTQLALADHALLSKDLARAEALLDSCPTELRGWEWRYLKRRCRVHAFALHDFTAPVVAVAWSSDGRRLATASAKGDKAVQLWNATTGQLATHLDAVRCVSMSGDGKLLATAGADNSVLVWDLSANQPNLAHTFRGHVHTVNSVALHPDGRSLASASDDKTVRLWNLAAPERPPTVLSQFPSLVAAVAFSPDGRTFATACGKNVRLWETTTAKVIGSALKQPARVTSLAFSPNSKLLAAACVDGVVPVWEVKSHSRVHQLVGHGSTVTGLAFAPTGRRLATAGEDGTLRLWDTSTGEELFRLHGAGGVAWSADGGQLLAGRRTGGAAVWYALAKGPTVYGSHEDQVNGLAFASDGKWLASAGRDKKVRIWDWKSSKEGFALGHNRPVLAVTFSADGCHIATTSGPETDADSADSTLSIWDVARRSERVLRVGKVRASAVAFSPDGKCLASADSDRTVRLWEVSSGTEVRPLAGHSDAVMAVAFSPDGKLLASVGADEVLKVWDGGNGKELRTVADDCGKATALAFSPDGRKVAVASGRGVVRIWDISGGRELYSLLGHTSAVASVAFSPDGTRLATAAHDDTVRLWDAADGRELLALRGHKGIVCSVAFSPDGNCLLSGGRDGAIRLWDASPLAGDGAP